MRLLRRRYPEAQIDFWGSEATADFERALCGDGQPFDWRISWDRPHTGKVAEQIQIVAIANAVTQRHEGWPTRPGNQLRRFQPADPDPDKLAPTHLGCRRQSAR